MLGNKNAERSLDYIQAFCKAGIVMNGQIVICPGWNDGDQLRRTLRDLTEMEFSSCSLVPVGITKYRQGLAKLRPVSAEDARDIIAIAEEFGQENLRRFGTRRFFCADELYLRAGLPLPQEDYYEGYRQLENGVGMLRSLEQDFLSAMRLEDPAAAPPPFTIATGTAAAPSTRMATRPTTLKVTVMRYSCATEKAARSAVRGTSAMVAMQAQRAMPPG